MRKLPFNLLSLLLLALIWSCSGNTSTSTENKTEHGEEHAEATHNSHDAHASSDDCSTVHWGYAGESGPEKWDALCSGFTACGGESQSPINIHNAVPDEDLNALEVNYTTTTANIKNNGHTVVFNCEPGSKLTANGMEYELLQFHFHGLSEHQVDGENYPLEVHFVNKADDMHLAVIGVLFEAGEENPLLANFLSHFPHEVGEFNDPDTKIDIQGVLPSDKSYYYYNGSLTTPPCSEVVNWYVLKNPLTASAEQIKTFQAILHDNYRPVQDLHGRTIAMYAEE